LKELELKQKYEELKASGRLEKYLAKKRRKQSQKEHKFVPLKRRRVQETQTS
jgi:hypothetical protein